jgi:hypothetical protein
VNDNVCEKIVKNITKIINNNDVNIVGLFIM